MILHDTESTWLNYLFVNYSVYDTEMSVLFPEMMNINDSIGFRRADPLQSYRLLSPALGPAPGGFFAPFPFASRPERAHELISPSLDGCKPMCVYDGDQLWMRKGKVSCNKGNAHTTENTYVYSYGGGPNAGVVRRVLIGIDITHLHDVVHQELEKWRPRTWSNYFLSPSVLSESVYMNFYDRKRVTGRHATSQTVITITTRHKEIDFYHVDPATAVLHHSYFNFETQISVATDVGHVPKALTMVGRRIWNLRSVAVQTELSMADVIQQQASLPETSASHIQDTWRQHDDLVNYLRHCGRNQQREEHHTVNNSQGVLWSPQRLIPDQPHVLGMAASYEEGREIEHDLQQQNPIGSERKLLSSAAKTTTTAAPLYNGMTYHQQNPIGSERKFWSVAYKVQSTTMMAHPVHQMQLAPMATTVCTDGYWVQRQSTTREVSIYNGDPYPYMLYSNVVNAQPMSKMYGACPPNGGYMTPSARVLGQHGPDLYPFLRGLMCSQCGNVGFPHNSLCCTRMKPLVRNTSAMQAYSFTDVRKWN